MGDSEIGTSGSIGGPKTDSYEILDNFRLNYPSSSPENIYSRFKLGAKGLLNTIKSIPINKDTVWERGFKSYYSPEHGTRIGFHPHLDPLDSQIYDYSTSQWDLLHPTE